MAYVTGISSHDTFLQMSLRESDALLYAPSTEDIQVGGKCTVAASTFLMFCILTNATSGFYFISWLSAVGH